MSDSQVSGKLLAKSKDQKEKVVKQKSVSKKTQKLLSSEAEEFNYDFQTEENAKKNINGTIPKSYDPAAVEKSWYNWWESQGYFTADATSEKEKYTIVIPPPNVTGHLHIGHALTNAIQDALIRYHKMNGYETLWLPGTDHAGIATQVVVERQIAKESNGSLTRHDLGRDAFIDRVWEWVEDHRDHIYKQLRVLGSALDWSRDRFTMDEGMSYAVCEAFVRYFEDSKIYRDNRLVNWDATLKTAISDVEIDYETFDPAELKTNPNACMKKVPGLAEPFEFGKMDHFLYPVVSEDGKPDLEPIEIATTRLETMLGDVAVAVNSKDPATAKYQGRKLRHPFTGRIIPVIIDDELVEVGFGTGAVKITPAHDPNDFAAAARYNATAETPLEIIDIFTDEGMVADVFGDCDASQFVGQHRLLARLQLREIMTKMGLYVKAVPHKMTIPFSQRSSDLVEPKIKPQWYVDTAEMGKAALDAVCGPNPTIRIEPVEYVKTWERWLGDIRPWCISRQLWWGHRIPAYLFWAKGSQKPAGMHASQYVAAHNEADARTKAATILNIAEEEVMLDQDPDVLDTWFSSGLFPFATMGWPHKTPDLEAFFPGSVLETGNDILFFWVARMVMMSISLCGVIPFTDVFLHSMVRDAHGEKMSKSKGNVIDPLHLINGCSIADLNAVIDESTLPEAEKIRAKEVQKADFGEGIPRCGADALRFVLCNLIEEGRDINLDINRVVTKRSFCNKIWNAVSQFAFKVAALRATADENGEILATAADFKTVDELEQEIKNCDTPIFAWILHRLSVSAEEIASSMKDFRLTKATNAMHSFFLHDICDVYIEAIKPYLWDKESANYGIARSVLLHVIDAGLRLFHPFMPFLTEELWQHLPRVGYTADSIMVAPYPVKEDKWVNFEPETLLDTQNDLLTKIRSSIEGQKIKFNSPPRCVIVTEDDNLEKIMSSMKTLLKFEEVVRATEFNNDEWLKLILTPKVTAYIDKSNAVSSINVADIERELARVEKEIKLFSGIRDKTAGMVTGLQKRIDAFEAEGKSIDAEKLLSVVMKHNSKIAEAEDNLAALEKKKVELIAMK